MRYLTPFLNTTLQEGLTALMMAVKEGNTSLVEVLVDRADVNIQENVS